VVSKLNREYLHDLNTNDGTLVVPGAGNFRERGLHGHRDHAQPIIAKKEAVPVDGQ
jgi:hypothetical protein